MSLASSERRRAPAWGSIFRVTEILGAAWIEYLRRRRYLHELGELSAMDDLSLRDIGISRCEVRAAIRSGEDLMSLRR